jgi:hypothetical protein
VTDEHGGPLDVATLEVLPRRAGTHPLVDAWAFEPDAISPRRLRLSLDEPAYPTGVDAAQLDVRWFVGDDYTFHYLEHRDGDRWECRWDRHAKTDAPVEHYHPPPDAGSPEDSPLDADHHLDALFAVLDRIDDRVRQLHGD